MRLYPKQIPIISHEIVQLLMQDGGVEIEPTHTADVEKALTANMREYLTSEERVNQATREALERRGYAYSKFHKVRLEMAETDGFQLESSDLRNVSDRLGDQLLASPELKALVAEEGLLGQKILNVMMEHV